MLTQQSSSKNLYFKPLFQLKKRIIIKLIKHFSQKHLSFRFKCKKHFIKSTLSSYYKWTSFSLLNQLGKSMYLMITFHLTQQDLLKKKLCYIFFLKTKMKNSSKKEEIEKKEKKICLLYFNGKIQILPFTTSALSDSLSVSWKNLLKI